MLGLRVTRAGSRMCFYSNLTVRGHDYVAAENACKYFVSGSIFFTHRTNMFLNDNGKLRAKKSFRANGLVGLKISMLQSPITKKKTMSTNVLLIPIIID